MSIASRLASEARRGVSRLVLAGFLALAPSWVPAWRLEPRARAGAVLMVGEPTFGLWWARGERGT